jgi:uncharacterized protein YqeY
VSETVPGASTDKLVKVYIKMRDKRSELKSKFEQEDIKIKEQMDAIESVLLETCKLAGASSIKTSAGTVMRGVKTQYWTSDWESMHKFIKENNALELLERRISQRTMGEFLQNHPDKMPPGMNVESRYVVTIRRS